MSRTNTHELDTRMRFHDSVVYEVCVCNFNKMSSRASFPSPQRGLSMKLCWVSLESADMLLFWA